MRRQCYSEEHDTLFHKKCAVVLQCDAACCSVMLCHGAAVCHSELQCVAICCSMLLVDRTKEKTILF